jgi:hypothetical protein
MEWILCEERLPEKPGKSTYEHVFCLVTIKDRGAAYVTILAWNCEHLCWDDESGDDISNKHEHVTHWMPLPEPPQS